MLQKNSFWQTLDSLNGREYIDYAAKGLLAYKGVAAYVLKGSISELADCSVQYIAKHCIVGEPVIAGINVHRDAGTNKNDTSSGNCNKDFTEKIDLLCNEDSDINEGKVTFDVIFKVRFPSTKGTKTVIINLEAQNRFNPGYPLVTRGIYYDARMISAQYEKEFSGSDYHKIKKVYSIWICTNPDRKHVDTISRIDLSHTKVFGNPDIRRSHYDKMEVTVIGLHRNGKKKSGNPLIDMLSVLFDRKMNKDIKRSILEKEYGIRMTRKYNEVIDKMCNISEYWIEPYYKAQKIEENAKKKIANAEKMIADAEKIIADADKKFADADKMIADAERKSADADKMIADAEKIIADADKKSTDFEAEKAKLISLLKARGMSEEEINTALAEPSVV